MVTGNRSIAVKLKIAVKPSPPGNGLQAKEGALSASQGSEPTPAQL
jgi:hypothetical protein